MKNIYDITPFSLLDFPGKSSCIIWLAGCNMRCQYCYNPEIVFGKGKFDFQEALDFIAKRKKLIDGVVISGGEATLHSGLIKFCEDVVKMGLLIKLDTNGTKPDVIQQLLHRNLISYFALDFKCPEEKFVGITKSKLYLDFIRSLKLLIDKQVDFEVRTTLHQDLLSQKDLNEMLEVLDNLSYRGNYYLQYYRNNSITIQPMNYSPSGYINLKELTTPLNVLFRNN